MNSYLQLISIFLNNNSKRKKTKPTITTVHSSESEIRKETLVMYLTLQSRLLKLYKCYHFVE